MSCMETVSVPTTVELICNPLTLNEACVASLVNVFEEAVL